MGVTKQYLRFKPASVFGLIASSKGGVAWISPKKCVVACSAAELVFLWNLKTGEKLMQLHSGDKHEVSCMTYSQCSGKLAVGYENGSIRFFDLNNGGECEVTLNGHKSGVTRMSFDEEGHRLVSGSKDTTIIVWDVINECGLFRLKGHKGPVTNVAFVKSRPNVLVSSSKDTFVKFWDLSAQHCFKTLTGHINEVWDFALIKEDQYLVTGTIDAELRVWRLDFRDATVSDSGLDKNVEPGLKKLKLGGDKDDDEAENDDEDNDDGSDLVVVRVGSLLRSAQDRVSNLVVDQTGRFMTCHGSDNSLESFLICTPDEVKRRLQKKAKKERRKKANAAAAGVEEGDAALPESTIQEEFRRLKVIKAAGKVRQVDVVVTSNDQARIIVLTANNLLEEFSLSNVSDKMAEPEQVKVFDHAGHRSDVRTLCFSSDHTAIASVSSESLKIWNRASQTCIRTVGSGYGLSCLFAPGDRHVIVGTKKGGLQFFDLSAAVMTEEIAAHGKEIWAMDMLPDKKGFVTASGDKTIKFWQLELIKPEAVEGQYSSSQCLSAVHVRTLELQEDCLNVKVSRDGRLVVAALLDCTVKAFFVDTLKFFLSMYGHHLPVLCMDISSDGSLLATGSADKNVKIWGLDFGDCHKSLFAHDDAITSLSFLPNTHMFFTASKDGSIKQWDADNFQRILTLSGHHNEVWSMAVSGNGKFVASAGHDKTLRLWERSQETLVLDDERETEREMDYEQQLASGQSESRTIPGEQNDEVGLPSKKTPETERGADRLMEAMEVYEKYQAECDDVRVECDRSGKKYIAPPLPVLMMIYGGDVSTADDYLAQVLSRIKSSDLEETLLMLPFDQVIKLLHLLERLMEQRFHHQGELLCRLFFFLSEIHFGPLSAAAHLKPLLQRLRQRAALICASLKDTIGYNLSALNFIQTKHDQQEKLTMFLQATTKVREKRRKAKQKQTALQTAILSL